MTLDKSLTAVVGDLDHINDLSMDYRSDHRAAGFSVPRQRAMQCRDRYCFSTWVRLSVRLSIRLSHSGIVSKRIRTSSNSLHHLIGL